MAPTDPTLLVGTVISGFRVDLSWTDNSNNEDGFSIERDSVEIATVGPGVTTYSATGLTPGQAYDFRVRGFNGTTYSSYTNTVNATPSHQEGYPAFTAAGTEPNVAAQWRFDEASGAIIDEVSSLSIAVSGTPTFSVAQTGAFAGLTPGISYTTAQFHQKATATAELNLGTGDFTIECWYANAQVSGTRNLFFTYDNTTNGYFCQLVIGSGLIRFRLVADDLTVLTMDVAGPSGYNNGTMHKLRYQGTRAGNLVLFFDGVSTATASLAGLVGKAISASNTTFAANFLGAGTFGGTISEWRLSNNATNNSGGPGGG